MTPLYSKEYDSPVKLVPYKDPGCVWIFGIQVIFCPRAVQQSCTGTVTNTRHSRKYNNQSFVRKKYSEMLIMKYISVGLQFEAL